MYCNLYITILLMKAFETVFFSSGLYADEGGLRKGVFGLLVEALVGGYGVPRQVVDVDTRSCRQSCEDDPPVLPEASHGICRWGGGGGESGRGTMQAEVVGGGRLGAVLATRLHEVVHEAVDVKFQIRVAGGRFYIPIGLADGQILCGPGIGDTIVVGIGRFLFAVVQRPAFDVGVRLRHHVSGWRRRMPALSRRPVQRCGCRRHPH